MRKKIWIAFVAPPAIVLFVWLCGEVVMHLWNWLLPMLFGWHPITFWQGLGLMLLCRILFGSWGGHGGDHGRHRGPWGGRWERMSPEEREKLRHEMRARWCGHDAPHSENSPSA